MTLGRQLRDLAPGLTPRSALEKFAALQMIDVHLPTSDGRQVVLTRYTQPEPDLDLSAPFETGVASSVPTQNYRLSDRSPSQASVVKTLGILSLIPNALQLSHPPIRQVGLARCAVYLTERTPGGRRRSPRDRRPRR